MPRGVPNTFMPWPPTLPPGLGHCRLGSTRGFYTYAGGCLPPCVTVRQGCCATVAPSLARKPCRCRPEMRTIPTTWQLVPTAPWMPVENKSGISGSPCSPPSAWVTTLHSPHSLNQLCVEGCAYEKRTNGRMAFARSKRPNLPNIAALNTSS